jgi:hypothetical protein
LIGFSEEIPTITDEFVHPDDKEIFNDQVVEEKYIQI